MAHNKYHHHEGIGCSHCGVDPIVGIRYADMTQYPYNLCQVCYKTLCHRQINLGRHAHELFLEIATPLTSDWEEWHHVTQRVIQWKVSERNKDKDKLEEARRDWVAHGGQQELEPALRSGAIALLNAEWIVSLVKKEKKNNTLDNKHDPHTLLSCRQELPSEAFLSVDQIIHSTSLGNFQILCLSYMWLNPTHPDPKGTTLQQIERYCEKKLMDSVQSAGGYPQWGLFWDFGSLHQHNPHGAMQGVVRTLEQEQLFRKGLDALPAFFAHPKTSTIQVTQFPKHYPQGYNLPDEGANCAPYHSRGWPTLESCLASMIKGVQETEIALHDMVDLSLVFGSDDKKPQAKQQQQQQTKKNHRLPPLTPQQMEDRLVTCSFTNGKEDRPLVLRLYTMAFTSRFAHIKILNYGRANWDDTHVAQLAHVLGAGHLPLLEGLHLNNNHLGLDGCRALAAALADMDQCCPHLRLVNLSEPKTDFGDACVQVLAKVLLRIRTVELQSANLSQDSCRALRDAARGLAQHAQQGEEGQHNVKLRKLNLRCNQHLGDEGLRHLTPLVVEYLEVLDLMVTGVGDQGCAALADAACNASSSLPLKELYLADNSNIGEEGCYHISTLLQHCPQLERLALPMRLDTTSNRVRDLMEANLLNPKAVVKFW